jgi:hypothetical protein
MLQQTFCEEIISCNSRFQYNNQLRKAEETDKKKLFIIFFSCKIVQKNKVFGIGNKKRKILSHHIF